jgi:cyclic pyranopterin phosphate synthase
VVTRVYPDPLVKLVKTRKSVVRKENLWYHVRLDTILWGERKQVSAKSLIDPEGRPVTHLRMSVTQKCNLQCAYCHHEGEEAPGEQMSGEMACEILRTFAEHGVNKLKITGGEPLLREDIYEIIRYAKDAGFEEVSLTTNGTLLPGRADRLKGAGLDRLNIGCDSLSSSVLPKTAGAVLPALKAAREAGFENTKLNMVVLKGVNDGEIEHMIEFAGGQGATLQLIELIPTGNGYFEKYYFDLRPVEKDLEARANSVTTRRLQDRRQYHLPGVDVEVVRPFHGHFCKRCTKMRVTSDGQLRPCLMRNDLLVPFTGTESLLAAVSLRRAYSPGE